MGFLSDGLTWFQEQRHRHASSEISIGYVKKTAHPILATVSKQDATSTVNRLTVQRQVFHFVVRRCDLEKHKIKIHRGLKIWYLDDEYELVYDGNQISEYNDPDRLDIILRAVLVRDNESVSPTYRPS